MQHQITQPSRLLNQQGELIQKGYATSLILDYIRKDVKNKLIRLKEWDYYLIYNNDFAVAVTVGTTPVIGLISATFIGFNNINEKSGITISVGGIHLPQSSEVGDINYTDAKTNLSIKHDNNLRKLHLLMKNFEGKSEIEVSIDLFDQPKDSMLIATPFRESIKEFYYNQKIIGMRASGVVRFGGKEYKYTPDSSFGLLDWGRGAWPHKVTWYWSAAQGMVEGKIFGFNLGYGFGDTSFATENMLFYDGIASKLKDVEFIIPKNNCNEYEYMKPWIITSCDERIEMEFIPIFDRNANLSALILSTEQHQVFGKFTGKAVLNGGKVIEVNNLMGFAEKVKNKW
jgi:Protein of unknown function (DUF2804).